MEGARSIYERAFGPNHPLVATTLHNRALLLTSLKRFDDAERGLRSAEEESYSAD